MFAACTVTMALASCSTLVEDVVSPMLSSDVNSAYVKAKPSVSGTKGVSTKQKAKEQEALKKAGKCPVCAGVGRSPDGQYVCEACKGTGRYADASDK
jgi:DnaJ-class molecular chaperone